MAWVLGQFGYEVVTAVNGRAGLDVVERRSPDLILLDNRMPVMDGLKFAEEYRRGHGPKARIILMTAGTQAQELADRIGADCYLQKPFDLTDLERAIGDCLDPG